MKKNLVISAFYNLASKLLLSLLFMIWINFTLFSQDQIIPFNDFEDWTISYNGTDSLIGWSSTNSVVIPPVESLTKDTIAYSGYYSCDIRTAPFGAVQYTTVGILVNGKANFEYKTNDTINPQENWKTKYIGGGGTPISFKPKALIGYYRYVALDSDEGFVSVILSKYNDVLKKRDTVSYATNFYQPSDFLKLFKIYLPDLMPNVIPDSITVFFYSSNPFTVQPFNQWSDLFIDSINLVCCTPTNIDESEITKMTISWPNPVGDRIYFAFGKNNLCIEITLININGVVILKKNINTFLNNNLFLNTEIIHQGIYILETKIKDHIINVTSVIKY